MKFEDSPAAWTGTYREQEAGLVAIDGNPFARAIGGMTLTQLADAVRTSAPDT